MSRTAPGRSCKGAHPLAAGARLFGETSDKKPMRLTGTQAIEGGIAYLTYQPVRDA